MAVVGEPGRRSPGLAALVGVRAGTNALRHRPRLARPDRLSPMELALFVIVPAPFPWRPGASG